MNDSDGERIRRALRKALAGNPKEAALTVFPDSPPDAAESRFSRVLSGALNIPAEMIGVALRTNARPLLEVFESIAEPDPATVRAEVRDELREIGLRVSMALQRLAAADAEPERARIHRVAAQSAKGRERAS